jgi:hypothetical protein
MMSSSQPDTFEYRKAAKFLRTTYYDTMRFDVLSKSTSSVGWPLLETSNLIVSHCLTVPVRSETSRQYKPAKEITLFIQLPCSPVHKPNIFNTDSLCI